MINQHANRQLILRNARIVLPDRTMDSAGILIDGDRIARILEGTDQLPNDCASIDLTGLTLFPGFIDVHIHGAVGIDMMETDSAGLFRIAGFLASQGVTAWLPTLVPAPLEQYEQAVRAIEEAVAQTSVCDDPGANDHRLKSVPLGVHYEGPFVNSEQCGALQREHFRTFKSSVDLDSLPSIESERAIHLMTLAPETEGGIDLIKELNRRGWIVSIGHTRALVPVLDQALAAGARHMTHFMNAMTPLHHRAPGPVGWGLVNDEVTCDVIADGIHLDASILKLILRTKGAERISLISDAIAATGQGDGDYQIWGEQITVKDGRTSNSRGSITGSVITMLDAVRMMLSLGLTEPEVARMASTNPARLLRLDNDRGSIEVGKRADLVALDSNFNVRATIIGGRVGAHASGVLG
ncbi:MAG: N-acetylglucosamine-6-phosphate deacetylase [Pyrinomonadaceae bacterium]